MRDGVRVMQGLCRRSGAPAAGRFEMRGCCGSRLYDGRRDGFPPFPFDKGAAGEGETDAMLVKRTDRS